MTENRYGLAAVHHRRRRNRLHSRRNHLENAAMTKRMSRFLQIASSAPHAQSRQRMLERKADQILRQSGFYKPMDKEHKDAIAASQRYNLRAFLDPNRS